MARSLMRRARTGIVGHPRPTAAGLLLGAVVALSLVLGACGSNSNDSASMQLATDENPTIVANRPAGAEQTPTPAKPLPTPAPRLADGSAAASSSAAPDETTTSTSTKAPASSASSSTRAAARTAARLATGIDCTKACNLVLEGDSLFHSFAGTLCAQLGTLTCVNSGIVGNRIDQMVTTARSDVDNHVGTGNNDVLVLWAGTNDLWQDYYSPDPNNNAEQTYGWISTYVRERRAVGWDYIFVMTLAPANPNIIQGDARLNELIRQNSAGADAIIDLAADARLANPFDPVLKSADGVHYTDPGLLVVLNDHLIPAIKGLDGR